MEKLTKIYTKLVDKSELLDLAVLKSFESGLRSGGR